MDTVSTLILELPITMAVESIYGPAIVERISNGTWEHRPARTRQRCVKTTTVKAEDTSRRSEIGIRCRVKSATTN